MSLNVHSESKDHLKLTQMIIDNKNETKPGENSAYNKNDQNQNNTNSDSIEKENLQSWKEYICFAIMSYISFFC